ncbi:MAG: PQQ-like beta-propeller repeat protein [Planctomycetes bacterium]|nr:PQQ-like beta-propeller repeat protein [Planctomycetota bacterium]
MPRFVLALPLALLFTPTLSAAEWSQFRGPTQDGHADAAKLPTEWDKTKNVTWRKELPGNGWSSPVVAAGNIYLTTAVPGAGKGDYSLRAICLNAKTGEIVWNVEVFKEDEKNTAKIHGKNSHASPTPVVDGESVFVHFGHLGTACLKTKDGSKVWTQETLKYNPVHGAGGSPILADDKLIFCIDGTDKQAVIGLNKKTGKIDWQTPRKANAKKSFSFSTPLLISVDGRDQLIAAGSDVVMSLDPKSGEEIWRVKYDGYSVVPKPVFGNGLVYVCTGYDNPGLYAIKPNGKGDVTETHVAWSLTKNVAMPRNASPLLVGDSLYLAADSGAVTCLEAKTGTQRWNEARVGKAYSSSPVYAGGHVYLLDEDGLATVFKPGSSYDPVATIKMGEKSLASYGIDGDALLLRTEKALYRIEKK